MAKKQSPRPGKVVRLNTTLLKVLAKYRSGRESWSETLLKLIGNPDSSMWTLPSKLYPTKSEARGAAVKEAARQGLPLDQVEQPIEVKEKL